MPREIVFSELHRLVTEFDATAGNTGWSVDDALGQLLIRLNGEVRRARRVQNEAPAA